MGDELAGSGTMMTRKDRLTVKKFMETYKPILPPVMRAVTLPKIGKAIIVDESENPTGTHKDRLAESVLEFYLRILAARGAGNWKRPLPPLSVISSGSAAYAIQTALHTVGLPDLRVLYDKRHLDPRVEDSLQKIGCEMHPTDLSKKFIGSQELLKLTDNREGFVATSKKLTNGCYTRIAKRILHEVAGGGYYEKDDAGMLQETRGVPCMWPQSAFTPAVVVSPFGTGRLLEDIIEISKIVVEAANFDLDHSQQERRCFNTGDAYNTAVLRQCSFIGATTINPKSRATKLYAPFRQEDPDSNSLMADLDDWNKWIHLYKSSELIGKYSGVFTFKEKYLKQSEEIAAALGINAEPSALAGVAYLLEHGAPKGHRVILVSTGKTKMAGK